MQRTLVVASSAGVECDLTSSAGANAAWLTAHTNHRDGTPRLSLPRVSCADKADEYDDREDIHIASIRADVTKRTNPAARSTSASD